MDKKISVKFFKDNLPEWKRKKDSLLARIIYRPISFLFAYVAYKLGLTANQVSFISYLIAIVASCMFIIPNKCSWIIGCILIVIWMIMDCTDGNLARSIKSHPYGDFIDAVSSYTLIAFLFPCLGFAAGFCQHNVILYDHTLLVFLGSLTGAFDTLSRLYYQKYLNAKSENDSDSSHGHEKLEKDGKLFRTFDRMQKELGLNGIFIPFLIASVLAESIDIFIVFYFLLFMMIYLGTIYILIRSTKCLNK